MPEFSENVLFLTMIGCSLKRPPPKVAVLPEKVLFVIVSMLWPSTSLTL